MHITPTSRPQAIVTPQHEPEPTEEDFSEPGSTLPPTSPVLPTTPTTTRPPTTPAAPTPSPRKRKRGSNLILDYLKGESGKEQKRHEETEAKTERFLSLFEKLVDKMPQQ